MSAPAARFVPRNGDAPVPAELVVEARPASARVRALLLRAGGGLAIGALALPVPGIHLLGLVLAVAGVALGIRALGVTHAVRTARVPCARCATERVLFLGPGLVAWRGAVRASCSGCGLEGMLESAT